MNEKLKFIFAKTNQELLEVYNIRSEVFGKSRNIWRRFVCCE